MKAGRSLPRSRLLMALLLAATSVAWIGDGQTVAAAPAELISVDPVTGAAVATYTDTPSVSGDGNIVLFNTSDFDSTIGSTGLITYKLYVR
ncbi:MAG TPA: hypothetical protein VH761_12905, partial [Ilumatobacteraceae bacterium]